MIDGNYLNITKIKNKLVHKKYGEDRLFFSELQGRLIIEKKTNKSTIVNVDYLKKEIYLKFHKGIILNNFNNINNKKIIKLANQIAKLHSINVAEYNYGNFYSKNYDTWKEYLFQKIQLRVISLKEKYIDNQQLLVMLNRRLLNINCRNKSLVHGDLKPANILFNSDNIEIIDFDKCFIGDPIYDLGKLFWRCFKNKETKKWKLFIKTYCSDIAYEELMYKVYFYMILNVIGTIAFYSDYNSKKYYKIYKDAKKIIIKFMEKNYAE